MYVFEGRLIFKSYKPLRLEKGMYFLVRQHNEMVIIELDHAPMNDDDILGDYGYPVEMYIINQGNPNLDEDYILVYPDQIGWWDEGEHSDELYDITVKEINQILNNDCRVDVEVDEEEDDIYGRPIPIFINSKAILSHPQDDEEDEWEQDYSQNIYEDDQD
jgi:hypothetical protein